MKQRLDVLLVERGLAETRAKAQAMIMAGTIEVNGAAATKSGMTVSVESAIVVKEPLPYVSRGGLKLASAMAHFPVCVAGKVCMDIGASTGGFTDLLLQRGAVRVYAIDVGHGQLHWKLRNDPRVVVMEGLNFRYFSSDSLKEKVEFVTIDVSFISLAKILPVLPQCLMLGGEALLMVKPQFEVSPSEVNKGVVRDETLRMSAIARVREYAAHSGFTVIGGIDSAVKGPKGNIEHFLWVRYENKPS